MRCRYSNGCSFLFIKILLVAGGWDVGRSTRLASTEIFDSGSWRQVGELSHPANGVRGARLGNTVFMTGEYQGIDNIIMMATVFRWFSL